MLISVQFNPDIFFGILHLMHSKSFPGIEIVVVVGMQGISGWKLFQIRTVEGAVVADITQPPLPLSPGNPAHRGHPGEELRRRGRATAGGHRHFRPCAL